MRRFTLYSPRTTNSQMQKREKIVNDELTFGTNPSSSRVHIFEFEEAQSKVDHIMPKSLLD